MVVFPWVANDMSREVLYSLDPTYLYSEVFLQTLQQ